MNFDELMKSGWQHSRNLKSVEDQLRERLLLAENRIVSLENEIRQLLGIPMPAHCGPASAFIAKKVKRRMVTLEARKTIFATFGGRCFYCRCEMGFYQFTVDHQIPIVKGGSNSMKNLVASCKPCNGAKSDRMPTSDELERARMIREGYRPPPANVIHISEIGFDPSIQNIEREIEAKILSERTML